MSEETVYDIDKIFDDRFCEKQECAYDVQEEDAELCPDFEEFEPSFEFSVVF